MLNKSNLIMAAVFMAAAITVVLMPIWPAYATCPDDIFAYWRLDDASGGPYVDSLKANDGTGGAAPVAVTAGRVGGAQQFDGSTTQIDVPADNSFDWKSFESFSIEFWIQTSSPGAGNRVVIGRDEPGGGNLQWWVGLTDGSASFALRTNDGFGSTQDILGAGSDLADGGWHHIVAVRDDSVGVKANILYVDGVEQARSAAIDYPVTASFASDTAAVTIGALNANGDFPFAGLVDEVALYDRALPPTEIIAHRDAGNAGNGIESLRPQPAAVAGADQTVAQGAPVTLDGSTSSDDVVEFLWEQTVGTTVTINNKNDDVASFTAPNVDGTLTFQLTVTNSDGLTDTDTTNVVVGSGTTPTPTPPPASGGGGGGGCFIKTLF